MSQYRTDVFSQTLWLNKAEKIFRIYVSLHDKPALKVSVNIDKTAYVKNIIYPTTDSKSAIKIIICLNKLRSAFSRDSFKRLTTIDEVNFGQFIIEYQSEYDRLVFPDSADTSMSYKFDSIYKIYFKTSTGF